MRHLETGLQLASILCMTNYFNSDDFKPDTSILDKALPMEGSFTVTTTLMWMKKRS